MRGGFAEWKHPMSKTERPWPCTIADGHIKLCWALDEVIELGGVGTRYQGVKINNMINMKTMAFSRHLVTVKSGKHSKKGLVMNLCPFCGGELVEDAHKDVAARLTKRRRSQVSRPASNSEAK
jgi:hypothetical protein